jgi:hypothetical protein
MTINMKVQAPATGWIVENNAAPGSGKVELSRFARVTVKDETERYEVGLVKPAGKSGPVKAEWAFDTQKREQLDADEIKVSIR